MNSMRTQQDDDDREDDLAEVGDDAFAAEDSAGKTASAEAAEPRTVKANRSARRVTVALTMRGVILTVLFVLVAGAAATFGWLYLDVRHDLQQQQLTAENNARAEKVALDYAVNAAAMDYKDLGAWRTRLVAGTSPDLDKELTEAATSMEQLLVPLQWVSSAKPLAAKVRSVNAGVYVVDSFVSVQTKTIQAPEPLQSTATYSVVIDSTKNWQITDVGGIGAVLEPK